MHMHNPPHPGEFIKETIMKPQNISSRAFSKKTGIKRNQLSSLIAGKRKINVNIAIALAKFTNTSVDSWIMQQAHYDIWQANQLMREQDERMDQH